MEEVAVGIVAILAIFVALPWLILNYMAKGREARIQAGSPAMAGELMTLAERLERRLDAIETLLDHEVPGWRRGMDRRHG